MSETTDRVGGALKRYRVMAVVTGSFLLVVFVGLLRYLPGLEDVKEALDPAFGIVAVVHGWIYIVYLVTTVHLWMIMKWGLGRLIYMAAGGVVPLLSFFAERRVSADVAAAVEAK